MTAISINQIIENSRQELQKLRNEYQSRRPFIRIPYKEFIELLITEAEKIFISKGRPDQEFFIDDDNREVIIALHEYLTGFSDKIDVKKGIMLIGAIGSGKTILMHSFCKIFELLGRKIITPIHSMKLNSIIRESGNFDDYIKIPLFIDDLGKEEESVKSWGSDLHPLTELIAMRYDLGSWTFATSNYKIETLLEKYTQHTIDRMIEMFNILTLKGKSRRK